MAEKKSTTRKKSQYGGAIGRSAAAVGPAASRKFHQRINKQQQRQRALAARAASQRAARAVPAMTAAQRRGAQRLGSGQRLGSATGGVAMKVAKPN